MVPKRKLVTAAPNKRRLYKFTDGVYIVNCNQVT